MSTLPDHRTGGLRAILIRAFFLASWPVLVAPGWLRRALRRDPAPRKVYFFHIRKTAGTSLVKAYESVAGEAPDAVHHRVARSGLSAWSGPFHYVHRGDTTILRLSPYSFGWSHVPAWRFRVSPDVFTITILRDPVARVISLYNYLAHPEYEQGEAFQAKQVARELAGRGWSAFLAEAPRELLLNQLFMFSAGLDPEEAAERVRTLSAYFFTEDYRTGTAALSAELGVDLGERADRRSTGAPELPDAEQTGQLRALLADEYRLLELLRIDPGPGLIGTFPAASGS